MTKKKYRLPVAQTSPKSWERWFVGEEFQGVTSARTGPDKLEVPSKQPCTCEQCKKKGVT